MTPTLFSASKGEHFWPTKCTYLPASSVWSWTVGLLKNVQTKLLKRCSIYEHMPDNIESLPRKEQP